MTKKEFIDKVAERAGLSKKDATSAVNAVFEILEESLAEGDKLIIPGFGSFFVGRRAERKGRNPQTGQ
ncbi:MAG TPA: HU family DNA-binding protein, partial [Deltaproteobacteria bacterium]|nr:HU family DNA-binding protein [Deltaproteobacteria bacterium]